MDKITVTKLLPRLTGPFSNIYTKITLIHNLKYTFSLSHAHLFVYTEECKIVLKFASLILLTGGKGKQSQTD